MESNAMIMRQMIRTCTMATVSLALFAPPALAYFKVDEASNPDNLPHDCGTSRIEQRGAGSASLVDGYGTAVPLGQAVQALAPSGWTVKASQEVSDFKISWVSDIPWTQAIADGSPETICFVIDWDNQWVVASRNEIEDPIEVEQGGDELVDGPPLNVAENEPADDAQASSKDQSPAPDETTSDQDGDATATPHHYGASGSDEDEQGASKESAVADADPVESDNMAPAGNAVTPTVTAPPVKPAPVVTFHLEKGRRLSAAVRSFLSTYDWELAWESTLDFPIKYPMDIKGRTVHDVLGQITQLYPLQLNLYNGNRVVEVTSASSADTSIEGGRDNDAL